jgi:hypothetical protein
LNDVGSEEGRLPLLQFALKETWERREENRLTAEAYTAVGGVIGAIEKSAESVYNRLTPAQQDAGVRKAEARSRTRASAFGAERTFSKMSLERSEPSSDEMPI